MYLGWLLGLFLATSVSAHEMTPTYFQFTPSAYADGVSVTKMKLFNRRADVRYYEIEVYDKDWNHIVFATNNIVFKIDYLGKKTVEVYVRDEDVNKVTYICTLSKLEKDVITSGAISSRICSKMKEK
jgi:hypothetical protein